jgi:hypothetical protein
MVPECVCLQTQTDRKLVNYSTLLISVVSPKPVPTRVGFFRRHAGGQTVVLARSELLLPRPFARHPSLFEPGEQVAVTSFMVEMDQVTDE